MTVAILISAVVSLTLTPMLCARLLRHRPEGEKNQAQSRAWALRSRAFSTR